MRIARSGRFVFIAQWVAAVVLPVFFFIGRGFIGGQLGWLSVLGVIYGMFIIPLLLIPPILTLFDRLVRTRRATREAYGIAAFTLWAAFVVGALTVPDSGDGGHLDSALTAWTGGALGYEVSSGIFTVMAIIIGLTYLASVVIAIVGIVWSRRTAPAPV